MISDKMAAALNEQVNAEFWSAYLYLSMANNFEAVGRRGVANWFRIQFQEEQAHALALIDYLHAQNRRVTLRAIQDVPQEWSTILEAFGKTLEHEQKVTRLIHDLYALAESEKDFATRQMLNTFIAEQVEEEENVRDIIDDLTLVGDNGTGIYQLDRELGARTFVAPKLFK